MDGVAHLREWRGPRLSGARPPTAVLAVASLAVLAWIGLAVDLVPMPGAMASGVSGPMSGGPRWICMLPGGAQMAGPSGSGGPVSEALGGMPMWSLMALAMMAPAALPASAHVATNSLRCRRGRAVAGFLVAYLALWLAFGALVLLLLALLPPERAVVLLSAGLGVAALWELSPAKRWALNRCHRTSPLPPSGWRAGVGSARFGLVHGRACVASCWPLMVVMALAPSARLAWCALLGFLSLAEKVALRPRSTARRAGGVLLVAASISLAAALGAL